MVSPSLPMTVTARRNARLRAAALATIPFWLFLLAALPRVWAPDLAPFDQQQAAYVIEAIRRAPAAWPALYIDASVPLLAFVDPLLRLLPDPMLAWVVVRAILDALGVALLYLATRPLVGIRPALLVAVLYGANPLAWAAARDPSGTLGAVVTATLLLVAVRFVRRRTVLRGVALGAVLLLAVVPAALRCGIDLQAGWPLAVWDAVPSVLAVMFALIPFLLVLPLLAHRRWLRWGGIVGAILLGVGVAQAATTDRGLREPSATTFATLRDWSALACAVRETADRTGTKDVVVLRTLTPVLKATADPLRALLRDDVIVREVPVSTLLPLERETIFVLMRASDDGPVELRRASSRMMVVTPDGADTGARIATLRPRSAADWLARIDGVPDGRFADGSRLLGLTVAARPSAGPDVTLYWQLPVPAGSSLRDRAGTGAAVGDRIAVGLKDALRGRPAAASLPPPDARRDGEIVVQAVQLLSIPTSSGADTLQVTLYDAQGSIVRTAGGAESLDLPLRALPR